MTVSNINDGLKPARGLVTYESEGTEGGTFHSRILHVPNDSSGLTIGRGYDMKEKGKAKITKELSGAGVAIDMAKLISNAAGLMGSKAKKFITDNSLGNFEITVQTQLYLFELSYSEHLADVKKISKKPDCVEAYGEVNFEKIHPAIIEIMVDLRYRGDYTGQSRKLLQKHAANNDIIAFQKVIVNKNNWPSVLSTVPDRFKRRVEFINDAVAKLQKAEPVSVPGSKPAGQSGGTMLAMKKRAPDPPKKGLHTKPSLKGHKR